MLIGTVAAQDTTNTDSNAIVKLANIIADSEMKPAAPVVPSHTLEFWPAFLASIAVIVISELDVTKPFSLLQSWPCVTIA